MNISMTLTLYLSLFPNQKKDQDPSDNFNLSTGQNLLYREIADCSKSLDSVVSLIKRFERTEQLVLVCSTFFVLFQVSDI